MLKKQNNKGSEPKRSPTDYAALIAKSSSIDQSYTASRQAQTLDLPPIRSSPPGRYVNYQETASLNTRDISQLSESRDHNAESSTASNSFKYLHHPRAISKNAIVQRPILSFSPISPMPSNAATSTAMRRYSSPERTTSSSGRIALGPDFNTASSASSIIQVYSGPLDMRAQKTPSIRTAAVLPASERALVLSASAGQQATLNAYNLDMSRETRIFMLTSKQRRKAYNLSKSMAVTADKVRTSGSAGRGAIVQEIQKVFGRPRKSSVNSAPVREAEKIAGNTFNEIDTNVSLDWKAIRKRWLCRWLQKEPGGGCQIGQQSWVMDEKSESKLFALLRNSRSTTASSLSFLPFLLKHGPDIAEWPKGFTIPYRHGKNAKASDCNTHQSEFKEGKHQTIDLRDVKADQESVSESILPICPICLDYFRPNSPQLLLSCSHSFHAVCLDSFERFTVASSEKKDKHLEIHRCPECRESNYTSLRVYDGALLTGFYFVQRMQARLRGISVRRTLRKALEESKSHPGSNCGTISKRSAFFFKKLESISDKMQRFIEGRSEQVQDVINYIDDVLSRNKAIISAVEHREAQILSIKLGSVHEEEKIETKASKQVVGPAKCFVCLKLMPAAAHNVESLKSPVSEGLAALSSKGYNVHPRCASALQMFMSERNV